MICNKEVKTNNDLLYKDRRLKYAKHGNAKAEFKMKSVLNNIL